MFKKALLILAGLFLVTASAWAGRCPPPPGYSDDVPCSYIVIEGTISGLPSSYLYAYPLIRDPFSNLPSGCSISRGSFGQNQDPSHPYYCYYIIFQDTATKRECWDYFNRVGSINLQITGIALKRNRSSQMERWIAVPSSVTVTPGPVQTR